MKRYEHWNGECDTVADGDWVKYSDHLAAMEAKDREIDGLKSENTAMYGAILEAADMGSVRCKLELQRIAAEDAGRNV